MFFLNKKYFAQIVTALCLYGGPGVLLFFHYPLSEANSGAIFRLHPAGYLLVILTAYNMVRYNFYIGEIKYFVHYTLAVIIVLIYSLAFGASKSNFFLVNVLLLPSLIIYNFQFITIKQWRQVMGIIKFFFYATCILAILEHLLHYKLFPVNETILLFRSNAFQGHPLNNSLFLIFFSLFFYSYENVFLKRMIIIGLTVGALASFGVRSGLVAYSLGIAALSFKFIENGKVNFSLKNILTLLILVVSVVYIVFYTSLGERIINTGGFSDNSADVRFGVYSMFGAISFNDIIWGAPQEVIDYLMYIRGIEIIENFWIIWIFKYGAIFTAYLGFSFVLFMFRMSKLAFPTKQYDQLVVFGCFMLAASSNNSLAINTTVIDAITILCLAQYKLFLYKVPAKPKQRLEAAI